MATPRIPANQLQRKPVLKVEEAVTNAVERLKKAKRGQWDSIVTDAVFDVMSASQRFREKNREAYNAYMKTYMATHARKDDEEDETTDEAS